MWATGTICSSPCSSKSIFMSGWSARRRMAQALCRVPADIIGARWDHIDKTGAKARFLPPVNAVVLAELDADTQFIVNTTPNFSGGTHERVLHGFAAKSCVISDDNDFTRRRFGTLPSYFGFDWTDPDWAEKIAVRFAGCETYDERVQPALDLMEKRVRSRRADAGDDRLAELDAPGDGALRRSAMSTPLDAVSSGVRASC